MSQTLGERIANLRKKAGLTQEELAEKLGISPQAVSKWENDISCPDIMSIPNIAKILGVSTDMLLSGEAVAPVSYVPAEQRKKIDDMLLRLVLTASENDGENIKVKINLPMGIVKAALETNMISSLINIGDADKIKVDMNKIISQVVEMAERGLMGNILELDVGGEDNVHMEFFVE